jgi:8-oxo-dGTP pyrophosphatase MutT (NUDIX family)
MAEQLFQIGIKGLIQDIEGKILLLKIPKWGQNPEHWDMPGGRMDPGETFLQTLQRELKEEINLNYVGIPQHLMTVLSAITIPVGDVRVPLVLMAYKVELPSGAQITLDPNGPEQEYAWFEPTMAAKHLGIKYSPEFCEMVATL